MEKGVAKIIFVIALIIIIIVGAVAIGANMFKNKDKSYTLETIAENEYKYFVVYTGGKYGVINTKRRNGIRKYI